MKRLLYNSQLDERDKWTQYDQMLQRYLRFKEQERQPIKVSVEESHAESLLSNEVVDSVPKIAKRKAKLLLQRLENSDSIKWDRRGEVTINGLTIPGSNIIDLVGDAVRARKTSNPLGWQMFTELLKEMNVPREFLGNPRRLAYIANRGAGYVTPSVKLKLKRARSKRRTRYRKSSSSDDDVDKPRTWSKLNLK